MENTVFAINDAGTISIHIEGKRNFDPCFIPYTKNNLKWITNLYLRSIDYETSKKRHRRTSTWP